MRGFAHRLIWFIGAATVLMSATLVGIVLLSGHWMRIDNGPSKADYIFPLAGDVNRLFTAFELYQQGYASKILMSNAYMSPPTRWDEIKKQIGYPSWSRDQLRHKLADHFDIPYSAFEEFGSGHISTVEEAEALARHLGDRKVKILLITAPFHTRRAWEIMQDAMPQCEFTVTLTPEGEIKPEWWKDQDMAKLVVMEFAKTVHYKLGLAYRSTD